MPQTAVHFNSDQFVKDLLEIRNKITEVKNEVVSLKSEAAVSFKLLSGQYEAKLIQIDAIEKVVIGIIEGRRRN